MALTAGMIAYDTVLSTAYFNPLPIVVREIRCHQGGSPPGPTQARQESFRNWTLSSLLGTTPTSRLRTSVGNPLGAMASTRPKNPTPPWDYVSSCGVSVKQDAAAEMRNHPGESQHTGIIKIYVPAQSLEDRE